MGVGVLVDERGARTYIRGLISGLCDLWCSAEKTPVVDVKVCEANEFSANRTYIKQAYDIKTQTIRIQDNHTMFTCFLAIAVYCP